MRLPFPGYRGAFVTLFYCAHDTGYRPQFVEFEPHGKAECCAEPSPESAAPTQTSAGALATASVSVLAVRAIEGGALALDNLPYRLGTSAAWLAGAVVDKAVQLEVAAGPVAANEITQRAAAPLDGLGEGFAHC